MKRALLPGGGGGGGGGGAGLTAGKFSCDSPSMNVLPSMRRTLVVVYTAKHKSFAHVHNVDGNIFDIPCKMLPLRKH